MVALRRKQCRHPFAIILVSFFMILIDWMSLLAFHQRGPTVSSIGVVCSWRQSSNAVTKSTCAYARSSDVFWAAVGVEALRRAPDLESREAVQHPHELPALVPLDAAASQPH